MDLSAKFRQSFSHSRQTDAGSRSSAKFRKHILGNSFSVIGDGQLKSSVALHNLNIDDLGCRMTVNLGQAFLQNAK